MQGWKEEEEGEERPLKDGGEGSNIEGLGFHALGTFHVDDVHGGLRRRHGDREGGREEEEDRCDDEGDRKPLHLVFAASFGGRPRDGSIISTTEATDLGHELSHEKFVYVPNVDSVLELY